MIVSDPFVDDPLADKYAELRLAVVLVEIFHIGLILISSTIEWEGGGTFLRRRNALDRLSTRSGFTWNNLERHISLQLHRFGLNALRPKRCSCKDMCRSRLFHVKPLRVERRSSAFLRRKNVPPPSHSMVLLISMRPMWNISTRTTASRSSAYLSASGSSTNGSLTIIYQQRNRAAILPRGGESLVWLSTPATTSASRVFPMGRSTRQSTTSKSTPRPNELNVDESNVA